MSEEIIDVPEMDWRELPQSFTCFVIGAPESGKTFLIQFLHFALKHIYPVGTATCGTEDSQGAFTPILGKMFTQKEFVEEEQLRHYKRQVLCVKDEIYPLALETIDDCSDDPKIYSTRVVRASFKNGRQWSKRGYIVGLQYALDIRPEIRKLISFVAIFNETETIELEKIYKNFGGIFGSLEKFKKAMKDITSEPHTCLIILRFKKEKTIENCVRWYKAPAWKWNDGKMHPYPEGWRFGCKEFQEWNDQRIDPDYVEQIM